MWPGASSGHSALLDGTVRHSHWPWLPEEARGMVDYLPDLHNEEFELKLHDDTIQALFGIGLKIEYCIALFDESPDQAKAGLDGTISDLSELIEGLRQRIDRLK